MDVFNQLARLLRTRPIEDDVESDAKSEEWFRNLTRATDDARKNLDGLRRQFDDAIENLDLRDWTAMDAALRTPMIPHPKRETLLSRLPLDEQPVRFQPGDANGPGGRADDRPDPGFWTRQPAWRSST